MSQGIRYPVFSIFFNKDSHYGELLREFLFTLLNPVAWKHHARRCVHTRFVAVGYVVVAYELLKITAEMKDRLWRWKCRPKSIERCQQWYLLVHLNDLRMYETESHIN